MGMMDWMDGYDEEESADGTKNTVATDGLGFDEDLDDLSDEFGEFGDGDEFEDGDGDEFGGGDDFGGGGGGGAVDESVVAELEDRISDLENELSAVSSGMNTVREENKQIGETVEELDDTIRKLLDIYEMVTRGINPFVDDAREMGGLEGGGSFGIFEGEEEDDESLDPDVANAEAESFFDEDFGELDAEAGEAEAELAAEDELTDEERESPADGLDDGSDDESSDGGSGGSSFDDLKSEYEEKDGWDDELDGGDEASDEEDGEPDAADDSPLDEADLAADDGDVPTTEELVGDAPSDDETDADEESEAFFEDDAESDPDAGTDDQSDAFEFDHDAARETTDRRPEPTQSGSQPRQQSEPQTGHGASADASDGPEYLTTLPASYIAESVALEWTRFLVSVGGAIGAARALRQYREQEWISRHVERKMNSHVRNAASAAATEEPRDLRVEHHKESLTYISRLAGDVAEARLLEELSAHGRRGGRRGLRR